ncbi:uncharacterized protein BKA78DRAFT_70863 [Phyllosticta capitalensis]|uniref:uncharacterized protein n=1 Tax=Phyllosticta capitalensis TaxID=121624 RepID=UPI00312FFFAC
MERFPQMVSRFVKLSVYAGFMGSSLVAFHRISSASSRSVSRSSIDLFNNGMAPFFECFLDQPASVPCQINCCMTRCEVRSAVGFGGSVLVQTLYPIELVCLFSNEMLAATRSFDGLFGDLTSKFLFSAPCPGFSLSVSSGSVHQQMDRRGFGDGVRKRLRRPLSSLCVVEISNSDIAGPGPHPDLQVRRPLQISCSTP